MNLSKLDFAAIFGGLATVATASVSAIQTPDTASISAAIVAALATSAKIAASVAPTAKATVVIGQVAAEGAALVPVLAPLAAAAGTRPAAVAVPAKP